MPTLPSPGKVLKASILIVDGNDNRAMCTSHWAYTGGTPSATDLNTLATAFRSACTALDGIMNTSQSQTKFTLQDLSSVSGAQGQNTTAIAGTLAGTALTANVAACIVFQVARRFRGGKYKMFVPGGVTTSLLNNQTWTSAFIAVCNAAAVSWNSAFVGATGGTTVISQQVGVSFYAGLGPPEPPLPSGKQKQKPLPRATPLVDNVIGYSTSSRVGSQRKRLYR